MAFPTRRRGMTLVEIMVAIAIGVTAIAIALPGFRGILGLERASAAKELATTYRFLREEAGLRNVAFRIAFDLDASSWSVQVGEPGTLIFSGAEEREAFDEEIEDELRRYTQREIEEGRATEVTDKLSRFEGLSREGGATLPSRVQLPNGTRFAWVSTPQYEDPMEPQDPPPDEDDGEEGHLVVYSYIFPDGYMERTLIRLVDVDDPDDGLTIETEPLSGRVTIHEEELDPEELVDWIPDEGPELSL